MQRRLVNLPISLGPPSAKRETEGGRERRGRKKERKQERKREREGMRAEESERESSRSVRPKCGV